MTHWINRERKSINDERSNDFSHLEVADLSKQAHEDRVSMKVQGYQSQMSFRANTQQQIIVEGGADTKTTQFAQNKDMNIDERVEIEHGENISFHELITHRVLDVNRMTLSDTFSLDYDAQSKQQKSERSHSRGADNQVYENIAIKNVDFHVFQKNDEIIGQK